MREIIFKITAEGELIPMAEVIRCKDCKHRYVVNGTYCCDRGNFLGLDDEFCSDGEMREKEDTLKEMYTRLP